MVAIRVRIGTHMLAHTCMCLFSFGFQASIITSISITVERKKIDRSSNRRGKGNMGVKLDMLKQYLMIVVHLIARSPAHIHANKKMGSQRDFVRQCAELCLTPLYVRLIYLCVCALPCSLQLMFCHQNDRACYVHT